MPKAIRIHETGGPEVLRWEDSPECEPQAGEVRLRQTAVGLNFIDTYHRSGLYPLESLPSGVGMEGAGVVEAVGLEVSHLQAGDRVAYAGGPIGSYAETRIMPADRLVQLPKEIDDQQGAALMLKGLTTHYLLRLCYPVKQGETILIHAAAGGVGLLACQWAKHLGATVIGTVGTAAKAELAAAHGCDHPILYQDENWVKRVRELTAGEGVPVVYDSVGRDTFEGSLDCLKPRGLMVTFGQSSGSVPPLAVHELTAHGSLFLTRPTLATYTATREDLIANAEELFDVVSKGAVKIEINQTYPLQEAAQAHRDLEARKTTGATVLLP
ncbi:MAG: quinone oxidoreductase [Pirellulaceae bacterium]|nr:quinone oxidoreductase [Pirellulaceae bacterium]